MNDANPAAELPQYLCHKLVRAMKIATVLHSEIDGTALLYADESEGMVNYSPVRVSASYVQRHAPQLGGYYVVHNDGYLSFSPADAFDDGYALVSEVLGRSCFGIGRALKEMQNGQRVTRKGWNGPSQYLEMQVPDEHSKMTLPYIYIRTVQGDLVPWLASQTDLQAIDWMLVAASDADPTP